LSITDKNQPNKKAPTARVGFAEGAVLPFNPPGGIRNNLDSIADARG